MREAGLSLVLLALTGGPLFGQGELPPSTDSGPLNIKTLQPKPDKDGIYPLGPGIVSPELAKAVVAKYPPEVDGSIRYRVLFTVVVDADGGVKLRDSSPKSPGPFLDSATKAVKASSFQPGTLNGAPVPVLVCVRVKFSPDEPPIPQIWDCDQDQGSAGSSGASAPPDSEPYGLPPGLKPPVVINTVPPQFSEEARKAHFNGVVDVSTVVDKEGLPTEVRVVKSAGMGLDEKAVEAVSQYRFQPATLHGKPVAARITIEVIFHLME